MLDDEQNVEQDGEQAQAELGGIAENRLPVVWKQEKHFHSGSLRTLAVLTVIVSVQKHLQHGQRAAGEVQ